MHYVLSIMSSDSISTFLDITATGAAPRPEPQPDPEAVKRARALAEIAGGITTVDGVAAKTELSKEAAAAAVQWLSDNGLVKAHVAESGGTELGLTPTAESALE